MSEDKAAAPAAQSGGLASDGYKSQVDYGDLESEHEKAKPVKEPVADEGEAEVEEDTKAGTDEADADEADADSEDGDEDAGEDDGEEGEKPRKRTRADRYRDKITRLESENAQLRSRQASGSLTDAQLSRHVEEIIGPEPKEQDYPDYLSWDRDHTAWSVDRRIVTRQVKNQAGDEIVAHRARMAERGEAHQERVDSFRTRNGAESQKDFDTVMAGAKDLKASPTVEDLILDSNKSAHLVYYFAKHPERLDAINRMGERDAAREMGRVEARLSLPQQKVKTSAPTPKSTPRGGASPASQDADLASYLKKTYARS